MSVLIVVLPVSLSVRGSLTEVAKHLFSPSLEKERGYPPPHFGRDAILLSRSDSQDEFISILRNIGINIVDVVKQRGVPNPTTFLGSGRLKELFSSLSLKYGGRVNLAVIDDHASARQIVNIQQSLGLEVWDRLRAILHLFTSRASSIEARTQIRIAQLQADRAVIREVLELEVKGEHMGYGSAGRTAISESLDAIDKELATLRRRRNKHESGHNQHRRHRRRSGAFTIGLVGYTNAGKSTLFTALTGKYADAADRLFATLDTTVGRLLPSPRLLIVDTIGFMDRLPSEALDAFRSTLAEGLDADLTLLVVDASNSPSEIKRKIETSLREISVRSQKIENEVVVALTKSDLASPLEIASARDVVTSLGLPSPISISAFDQSSLKPLVHEFLSILFEAPVHLQLKGDHEIPLAALQSTVHDMGLVIQEYPDENDNNSLVTELWIDSPTLGRLLSKKKPHISLLPKNQFQGCPGG